MIDFDEIAEDVIDLVEHEISSEWRRVGGYVFVTDIELCTSLRDGGRTPGSDMEGPEYIGLDRWDGDILRKTLARLFREDPDAHHISISFRTDYADSRQAYERYDEYEPGNWNSIRSVFRDEMPS